MLAISALMLPLRAIGKAAVTPAEIDALTILVGGLDSREPGQPENADVFMIARIDLVNQTVRAISVPRDLYLEIPGFGYDKIGRTYDFGSKADDGKFKAGAESMKETVAVNFGVAVDGVVVTTFDGFQKLIDAFGGVEIDNPYEIYDAEYPTTDYGYAEIYYPAGPIQLSGADGLILSRTRHQDGDPGRVMRQQLILRGLLERAREPGIAGALPEMIDTYRKTVRTDLNASTRLALALAAPDFANASVAFTTLDAMVYSDYTSEGMWIYSGDWAQIPGYVQGVLSGAVTL